MEMFEAFEEFALRAFEMFEEYALCAFEEFEMSEEFEGLS